MDKNSSTEIKNLLVLDISNMSYITKIASSLIWNLFNVYPNNWQLLSIWYFFDDDEDIEKGIYILELAA